MRELKRSRSCTMWGVYFRVPDDEPVWYEHYDRARERMTAASAAAALMRDGDPLGRQVVVPRPIRHAEITRVRPLPMVGWRYWPTAHGTRPCGCSICVVRGGFKAQRLREAFRFNSSRVLIK